MQDGSDRKNYQTFIAAYVSELRIFEPTRVTASSKSCLAHNLTQNEIEMETVAITFSDYFKNVPEIHKIVKKIQMNHFEFSVSSQSEMWIDFGSPKCL